MVVTRSGLVEKRICIAAFRENADIKEAKRTIRSLEDKDIGW